MKKNNLICFVRSVALLPFMAALALVLGIYGGQIYQNILVQKQNTEDLARAASVALADQMASIRRSRAEAIDAYFEARNMPLSGTGMKMVLESEKHMLDWRLLPAIAVRESTGGKNACDKAENNSFGWASCKVGFNSNEQAIEVVAFNLGGKNPNTARHYENKTVQQILRAYNPPSVVPRYAEQVMAIMNAIGSKDTVSAVLAVNVNK